MDVARDLAPQLSFEPLWIQAGEQTKGRGRRARAWADPQGNLACTLLMPLQGIAPEHVALSSFVAALAVLDTVRFFQTDARSVTLKWPNDVLVEGRKVSGILLEAHHPRTGPVLSIGIGINIAQSPEHAQLEERATAPIALGDIADTVPHAQEVIVPLAQAFAKHWTQFQTFGFDPIRRAWMAHAAQLGCDITARLPNETYIGRFDGIDSEGCLLLSTHDGPRRIAAADIYF